MTAAERLAFLAGASGAAGVLLLAIGAGATAGDALVDYSGLQNGTAAEHLLVTDTRNGWLGGGGDVRKASAKDYEFLNPPRIVQAEEKLADLQQEYAAAAARKAPGSDDGLEVYVALLRYEINALQRQIDADREAVLRMQEMARMEAERLAEQARIQEEDIAYVLMMLEAA